MEPEKLLPPGEQPAQPVQTSAPKYFHLENKITSHPIAHPPMPAAPAFPELSKLKVPPSAPVPVFPPSGALMGVPSPKQQSWGVVISIVIIVMMIVIGAFYAWGERIAQERALLAPSAVQ